MSAAMLDYPSTTDVLQANAGESLSAWQVLGAFDAQRVALAETLSGHPGAFAGYDDFFLSVPQATIEVRVRARVVEDLGRMHRVEYLAETACVDGGGSRTVGRGVGLTLTPVREC